MKNHVFLILILVLSACGQSDFDIAIQAFDAHEYETALKKLTPLAESYRSDI